LRKARRNATLNREIDLRGMRIALPVVGIALGIVALVPSAWADTLTFTQSFDTGFVPQGFASQAGSADFYLPDSHSRVILDDVSVGIQTRIEARSSFTSLVDTRLVQGGEFDIATVMLPNQLGYGDHVNGSLGSTVDAMAGIAYTSDFTTTRLMSYQLGGGIGGLSPAHDPLVALAFDFTGLDYEGDAVGVTGEVRFSGTATFTANLAPVSEPAPPVLLLMGLILVARRAGASAVARKGLDQ